MLEPEDAPQPGDEALETATDVRVMYTARHRNIALLVAGCYFMEMLDGTNIIVP